MKKEILEKVLDSKKNLIVSGDISTGKTLNVLFPLVKEMIDRKESLLILDSKEEYINKYYDDLKSKNYNVVILNLRDLGKSEGWNPLEYPYNLYKNGKVDDAIDYIEKQAKIMFYEDSTADPFWSLTASDFYTGIVLGLFEDGKKEEINLNSVNLMFDGINNKFGISDYVTQYFKLKNPSSQPYVFASTTFSAPKETKGSIVSVARQKLRTYVSREMLSVLLNKTTFKYDDIITKPTAIFVIAKDENKYINNVATMFIEELFAILVSAQNHNKFNFVLDNIDVLEKIQELSDMLSSGVSRDIKFEIATRSYDDLIEKYGNYITKLSNSVVIGKLIKSLVNNEEFTEEVEHLIPPMVNVTIEYPVLNKTDIKMFNIGEFVCSKQSELNLNNTLGTTDLSLNSSNIDNFIKEIDKKIEKLETEEKIDKVEEMKMDIKSDFQQFKVED